MQTTQANGGTDHTIERTAERSIQSAREKLGDLNHRILSFIQSRPAACLVGAVAAGFIIGRMVSRR